MESDNVCKLTLITQQREIRSETEWIALRRAAENPILLEALKQKIQAIGTHKLIVCKPNHVPGGPVFECWYPRYSKGTAVYLYRPRKDGYIMIPYYDASGSAKRKAAKTGEATTQQEQVYAHHALWFHYYRYNVGVLPTPNSGNWHLSHLCHDPGCMNPLHLVLEPAWVNHRRKDCPITSCVCDMERLYKRCLVLPLSSYSPFPVDAYLNPTSTRPKAKKPSGPTVKKPKLAETGPTLSVKAILPQCLAINMKGKRPISLN